MSSYQHQCMLGNVMRDSHPDYLTCGYCAKEFLLDNITLFIAHKTGECDHSSHFRSATLHDSEDTSAPLTCSACSRVFMTARGLLHHVQEDHQMILCLQKGPLFLPHKETRPPPAHSSCNGVESTRMHADQSSCCFPVSTSSCAQNDQPTDLSMTCSNSLGKARVTCNEDKCEITIEPTCNAIAAKSASALPKKRKFTCPQQSQIFKREAFGHSAECDSEGRISQGRDDVDSRVSYEHHSETTSGMEAEDNDVSICVTAEYQKDTLCCVSLSTEKKEHDKHAKLKRLLQNTNPATEAEELQQQLSDVKTTTVVYKVPFLAPPNPESAVLKATASEIPGKRDSYQGGYTSAPTDEAHMTSPTGHNTSNVSRLTMEANIDRLIRSSISSDSFSEELHILSLQPESSSSRQPQHHRIDVPGTQTPSSPRLLLPGEKTTLPPHISVSCPSFDGSERNSVSSSIENWNNIFLGDDTNPQASSGITPVLSSSLLAVNSLCTGMAQHETLNLKNSLNFAGQSTPLSDKAILNLYSGIPLLRNHHGDQSSTQLCDNSTTFGQGLLKLLDQSKPGHGNKRESHLLEPSVSILADLTGGNPSIQQWLNIHSENSSNIPGTGSTSRPTASEHLDPVTHENVEQSSGDTLEETGLDNKAVKRRRYPTSRPFKCPSCDQAFNQRIHLKKHMSKHTGVKPFKCQQCDYSTVERSHLKVHYRIHTGEKPYSCLFCDYATAQNSTLKIHMKRHHETQLTSDCSSLKDNFQPTGSFDDETWTMQESVFLNPSLNTPTFDDELNRTTFFPGARTVLSLSMENSSLEGEKGGEGTRIGSSSPSSSTDQGQEQLLFATSIQQAQTGDSVTDRMSFIDTERGIRRKSNIANRGHYDNSNAPSLKNSVVKNRHTNQGTTSPVELRCSPGEEIGNLSCPSSEDSMHFRDNSVPGTFEDIQPSSVQVFVVQQENKLQSRHEELDYMSNKAQLPAKSLAKRKKGNIQTGKSLKSYSSEVGVNSVTEMDVSKEKEPTRVMNSNVIFQSEDTKTPREVNAKATCTSKETTTPNSLRASELIGVDVEEDEHECSSMDSVSVTIPTKTFVRG